MIPRAPHLQSHASAGALALDRHVVGVDLRRPPVEQDPALATDRVRPLREQPLGHRLHDRAAELAPRLLAAIGHLERRGEDRLGPVADRRRRAAAPPARTASGTSSATASGSVRLAVHRRPGEQPLGGRRRRRAAPRRGPRAGPPGCARRRPPVRPGCASMNRISSASPMRRERDLGQRRQPVDRPVRVGDPTPPRRRAPRSRSSAAGRGLLAAGASATARSRARQTVSRSVTYCHSSATGSAVTASASKPARARVMQVADGGHGAAYARRARAPRASGVSVREASGDGRRRAGRASGLRLAIELAEGPAAALVPAACE